jgi:hypothetical protein
MDILNFKRMTAEESIAHTRLVPMQVSESDNLSLKLLVQISEVFIRTFMPKIQKASQRG